MVREAGQDRLFECLLVLYLKKKNKNEEEEEVDGGHKDFKRKF